MFLRKLLVIVVPLLMVLALCLLLPLLRETGLFLQIISGAVIGIGLALVLPLSGAAKRREPFAGLLWVPALILILTVMYQYLHLTGAWRAPLLSVLAASDGLVILTECAFAGFLMTEWIRTRA